MSPAGGAIGAGVAATAPPLADAVPAEPLAPLADLLEDLRRRVGRPLGVHPSLRPQGPAAAWRPAADLADPANPMLGAMVDEAARQWNASRHAAAAMLWKTYAYWATLPVAAGWALNRRVPLSDLAGVRVRTRPGPPYLEIGLTEPTTALLGGDPCAGTAGTRVVAGEAALLAALRRTLLEDHLAPIVAALRRLTRVGERPLWGSVAEALAHPVLEIPPPAGRDPAVESRALLEVLGPPVAGLVDIDNPPGDGTPPASRLHRRTCCLAATVPGLGICPSCPLAARTR